MASSLLSRTPIRSRAEIDQRAHAAERCRREAARSFVPMRGEGRAIAAASTRKYHRAIPIGWPLWGMRGAAVVPGFGRAYRDCGMLGPAGIRGFSDWQSRE
jgi:hypothetical protein